MKSGRGALLLVVSAVVALVVVAGFLALGTPRSERGRRLDDARLEDLRNLRFHIKRHFEIAKALPPSLEALPPKGRGGPTLADPETGAPYGYEVVDDSTFRLCAQFDHPTETDPARMAYDPWAHGAGRQCYRVRIGHVGPEGISPQLEPIPELEPAAPPH